MKRAYPLAAWLLITGVFLWTVVDYLNRRAAGKAVESAGGQAKPTASSLFGAALAAALSQRISIS